MTTLAKAPRIVILSVAALLAHAAFAHAIMVVSCGTVVPRGETGILVGDLTCNGVVPSLTIERSATLDLNGYTLTVTGTGISDEAIVCRESKCTVLSSMAGGRIVAGGFGTVIAHLTSSTGKVVLRGIEIETAPPDTVGNGVRALGTVSIQAEAVRVSGTVHALAAHFVKVKDVTLTDNWVGIQAPHLRGVGLTTTGGGYGVLGGARLKLVNLEAHGARFEGVKAERIRLFDSQVTGNNVGGTASDIASSSLPHLTNTVCGSSQIIDAPPGTNWGICQND